MTSRSRGSGKARRPRAPVVRVEVGPTDWDRVYSGRIRAARWGRPRRAAAGLPPPGPARRGDSREEPVLKGAAAARGAGVEGERALGEAPLRTRSAWGGRVRRPGFGSLSSGKAFLEHSPH